MDNDKICIIKADDIRYLQYTYNCMYDGSKYFTACKPHLLICFFSLCCITLQIVAPYGGELTKTGPRQITIIVREMKNVVIVVDNIDLDVKEKEVSFTFTFLFSHDVHIETDAGPGSLHVMLYT